MSAKKLTIIIPTYQSDLYISQTLKHLVHQTVKQFKIWIIDDNSTDKTIKIIKEYKSKLDIKITVKSSTINKGAAASINYAFSKLDTECWALIDSDAFLNSNWVEEILVELKDKKVVGAPVLSLKTGGVIAYLIGLEIETRYRKIKKRWLHHLSTCNIAGRKEVLKFICLDEKLKYAYDHQLSFQLKKNGILFYLTKNTACHHLNKSGVFGYFIQQYKIAKYHMHLSKQMKIEAYEGDEISPNYLILQPIFVLSSLLILPFHPLISLVLIGLVLLLNTPYLIYMLYKDPLYFLPSVLLIYLKNISWIIGSIEGLIRKQIN